MGKCHEDKGKGLKGNKGFQENTCVCKGNSSLLLLLPTRKYLTVTAGKPRAMELLPCLSGMGQGRFRLPVTWALPEVRVLFVVVAGVWVLFKLSLLCPSIPPSFTCRWTAGSALRTEEGAEVSTAL